MVVLFLPALQYKAWGRRSAEEKQALKVQQWMDTLSPATVLEGESTGQKASWAKQTLDAMKKSSGVTTESIDLQAKIELCKRAEDLVVGPC